MAYRLRTIIVAVEVEIASPDERPYRAGIQDLLQMWQLGSSIVTGIVKTFIWSIGT